MSQIKLFDIKEFHFGDNLYIDASAGTGKTYTIQQLVAKLVRGENRHAGIPLSKILIVTYTDKATGELRDRIRQKMEDCLAEENLECYREALQNIHTAPIFTIHSFCQKVLHDFAYEAGSSFNLDVVSDDGIKNLIQRLVRDKWSYEKDFVNLLYATDFKMDLFVSNFVNAANRILQNRDVKCFSPDYSSLEGIFEWVPGARDAWNVLLENKDEVYEEVLKTKTNKLKLSDFIDAIKAYDGTGKLFPGTKFKSKWRGVWGSDELNNAVDLLFEIKDMDLQKDSIKLFQQFIFNHVDEVVAQWQKEKRDSKSQSFSDMINAVHDSIMNENGALVRKLRETYRYAIIDEFQDTNQLQWDIFKTIFLNVPQNEGFPENNIVVVGDPKQSIFSFQGADVDVYCRAIAEIGDKNGRRLSTNNRSSDDIIEACNELFQGDFFENGEFKNSETPPEERKKLSPALNGEATPPFWISYLADEYEFADFAVRKIVECCAPNANDSSKTSLQVYDKEKKGLRNVRFSDFAILSRTRSEMEAMEAAMAQVGIPYTRYKDSNLFYGKECAHWISLLKALDAPDFSSWNRKFLNEALVTDFFRVPLDSVENESFVYPTGRIMNLFVTWRQLVSKRRWAELQECIYQETEIDKYLSTPATLQQLAKVKQIGSYIFDYLYNNHVSLEEVIKHLQGLAGASENVDDADGNLVAKGSDFDAVNLMTIHSSKGLAFPIAIITGGLRGDSNRKEREPYAFSADGRKFIGFDASVSRATSKQEDHAEWRRLIYVAYTRAEALMIVPQYKIWYKEEKSKEDEIQTDENVKWTLKDSNPFAFLASAVERMTHTKYARMPKENFYATADHAALKKMVTQILQNAKKESLDTSLLPDFKSLQSRVDDACIYQYSYSSLASKKRVLESRTESRYLENADISVDGNRTNREEVYESEANAFDIALTPISRELKSIMIDDASAVVQPCENYDRNAIVANIANYPRGANLGDALHKVFENLDFETIGNLADENAACENASLRNLITDMYQGNSIHIQEHPEWNKLTASFVWNTMNAEFPEVHGGVATGKKFSLKDLPAKSRRAEMGFHLDSHDSKESSWVNCLCKGFIDLMFVRKGENGEDYYSILDWKSDVMDDAEYSDKSALSRKIEEDYSVQRVLYSYLLIKWLKQFYCGMTESQIYDNHFGGIYYALVRGTKARTCNGIYCQTWKSFADLENSYRNVTTLMKRNVRV